MKAFHFRLDQALRWRAAQRDLEKAQVTAAAKRLADTRAQLDARRLELSSGARQLPAAAPGAALEVWSAYAGRTNRQIGQLEANLKKAEQDLAARTKLLRDADRRVRLIENLKAEGKAEWQSGFDREIETFAGESFLGRLQSKKRARSSGG